MTMQLTKNSDCTNSYFSLTLKNNRLIVAHGFYYHNELYESVEFDINEVIDMIAECNKVNLKKVNKYV